MPLTPMPSPNAIAPPPSPPHFQLWTAGSRLSCSKPFRFTYFRKNASASPLESHTFKTKDLKPFRFTYFQKSGGGRVPVCVLRPVTAHVRQAASQGFRAASHGARTTGHEALSTSHQSRVTSHRLSPTGVS